MHAEMLSSAIPITTWCHVCKTCYDLSRSSRCPHRVRETTPYQSPRCSTMSIFMKAITCFLHAFNEYWFPLLQKDKGTLSSTSHDNRRVEYIYAILGLGDQLLNFKTCILPAVKPSHDHLDLDFELGEYHQWFCVLFFDHFRDRTSF